MDIKMERVQRVEGDRCDSDGHAKDHGEDEKDIPRLLDRGESKASDVDESKTRE